MDLWVYLNLKSVIRELGLIQKLVFFEEDHLLIVPLVWEKRDTHMLTFDLFLSCRISAFSGLLVQGINLITKGLGF